MTATNYTLFNPAQLVLELNETTLDRAWNQSQTAATPTSRWQTYLNQVALDVFLPWLKAEEDAGATVQFDRATRANISEVVNGTAIVLGDNTKLVLIPSEAEDTSELRVPQEWIDIPEWSADYYLAVQINVDAGYLRIWGYATHKQLKSEGTFSHGDRTYTLAEDDLVTDLDVLWVARELCPDEVTQSAIEPIAAITPAQAANLIQRLGDKAQLLPRLAIPFTMWAALIKNPTWCNNLAARRRGVAARVSVLQWLQTGASNLADEFGWRQVQFQPSVVGARSEAATAQPSAVALAKQLTIADQAYELKIIPLMEEEGAWRFELRSMALGGMIPTGFKLRLLTEELQAFEGNEDVATEPVEQLDLEVDLDAGESLVWQIEPTPDNYQMEVLYF
jgi:hypothetical protein